ncbi:GGDEF domain-containing protein [Jannaschia sp. LMIT008]|uniref:GGDEF domain-containing protein n=1 Tax=Jannaschia maritima TaxID=3032585 RepID=UPI002811289F|nr:GGDEF domain-containing protein [Jannaschia sp. LMIT008]
MKVARIDGRALDCLLPMNVMFDRAGRILHAGPTITKMAGHDVTGAQLDHAIRFRRPQMQGDPDELLERPGRRLMVDLRCEDRSGGKPTMQRLRAVVAPLPQGGGILQFAFGPDIAQAIRRHDLSATDFSPTDPVIEILYLLESQALIRAEMGAMAERMDEARRLAEKEAATDRLTGLANRRAMDRHLANLTASDDPVFGIMHLDLDHFKNVNDTLGHAAGDLVLEEVARILREETREDDFIARIGGDEFVMIFEDCTDPDILSSIAERVLIRLNQPIPYDGRACRISGSIGITLSPLYDVPEPDRLLSDADAALYMSKRAGRSRYAFHRLPPGADDSAA